ncbi:MAG TPA: NAD-dependent epimerase/dehydratase family protein [Polyangiaceae bacterium]|jgi:nucleoside-diphosphate-sugar epimerase|nr:NAD-dependent epimerase/dehydratase family protein [Polyangiaceae bacterium]
MTRRIAVVGFGAVGRETAALLSARGDAVRIVQRREPPKPKAPDGAVFQAADVEDREAILRACANVDTVVCCVGLPYDSELWARAWPRAMSNLLDGCAASGARFVFADNLYMYGPQTQPLTEDMPLTTYGRKPRIRAEITQLWRKAHDAGQVRAVAVRAPDFYGPDVATSVISAYGVARLVAGKAALVPYPADNPHDFTYVPDFARALVTLIDAPDDAYGQAWHVPNAPTRTLREILTMAAERIGVAPRINVLPPALTAVLALFWKDIAEIREMKFQWNRPYVVNSSKFAARFWRDATSFESGLEATIAFYRGGRMSASGQVAGSPAQ